MTTHRPPVTLVLVAGLLIAALGAACTTTSTSAETSDIFEAAPWSSGESLAYQVLNSDGDLIGHGTLESAPEDGLIALRQRYVEDVTPEGATPISDEIAVWVNASTFRPERGERTVTGRNDDDETTIDHWTWSYGPDDEGEPVVTITHDDGDEGDDPDVDTLGLRDHYYDNESSLWLWRSINLVEEFEAFYVSVNAVEPSQQTVNLRVPQTELVTVPAGEFEAYRLLFRNGRAVRTAWVEVAEPHRVLRWDNGSSILELMP